jgi:hypothetical protein
MTDKIITQEYLKTIFEYKDGELYWKIFYKNKKIGEKVDCRINNNYKIICFNGKNYRIHRIIFLLCFGYLPKLIDHKDGNSLNNNLENLREANISQNTCNSKKPITNSSGIKGIYWNKAKKKWMVRLGLNKARIYLGIYDDLNIAKQIMKEARNKYHGEFARHE